MDKKHEFKVGDWCWVVYTHESQTQILHGQIIRIKDGRYLVEFPYPSHLRVSEFIKLFNTEKEAKKAHLLLKQKFAKVKKVIANYNKFVKKYKTEKIRIVTSDTYWGTDSYSS